MTDHDPDRDDALKELDRALQVEPSRAFADGVRARVNRSRANTTKVWWGLAAAASIGLATMTLWRPATGSSANDAPAMVAVAPAQTSAPAVPSKAPESVIATAPVAAPVVTRREATAVRVAAVTTASEPRLEVITNQGAVLREMWARFDGQAGPLAVVEAEKVAESAATTPIVVDPIVVPPIVVSEIGKEPERVGGIPIIRRATATKETR